MFILKKGHQPGVYVPLRALFLVKLDRHVCFPTILILGTFTSSVTILIRLFYYKVFMLQMLGLAVLRLVS